MALKINNVNIGNSGEYYVAAELERRCFVVAVPMSNVDNFDVLAINKNAPYNQYAIQVKIWESAISSNEGRFFKRCFGSNQSRIN